MEYNECTTCGANDGRAGLLINDECKNCHETRNLGGCVVYSYLKRTPEELSKTFNVIKNKPVDQGG